MFDYTRWSNRYSPNIGRLEVGLETFDLKELGTETNYLEGLKHIQNIVETYRKMGSGRIKDSFWILRKEGQVRTLLCASLKNKGLKMKIISKSHDGMQFFFSKEGLDRMDNQEPVGFYFNHINTPMPIYKESVYGRHIARWIEEENE